MIDIRKINHGYWWDAQGKFDALVRGDNTLRELTIQITDRCNMACPKCNKVNFTSNDMATEDITRIIKEAHALGLRHIHFTGGEPTMHPDFLEILALCKTLGLRADMSTNGKFSDEYRDMLRNSGLNSTNVSWDFVDSVPECFRRGKPDRGWVVWFVNHMVMPSNYKELAAFLKLIKSEYPFVVDIQLMPPRGGATKFTKEQIDDFYKTVVPECLEISRGRYPMVENKLEEILADPRATEGIYHQNIQWVCHRSKTELRVGTKGFSTCTYLYRDGHVTCDLSNSVAKAWSMCQEECMKAPPIPHMCPYSCSPEVTDFNCLVDQALKSKGE